MSLQIEKEKRQLQMTLKTTKDNLATKEEELSDLREELSTVKDSSKEREKALKQKLKEMTLEKDRLTGLEVSSSELGGADTDWSRTNWKPSEALQGSGLLRVLLLKTRQSLLRRKTRSRAWRPSPWHP